MIAFTIIVDKTESEKISKQITDIFGIVIQRSRLHEGSTPEEGRVSRVHLDCYASPTQLKALMRYLETFTGMAILSL